MNQTIHINKYLPITLLYFFFNGFLLPHGLLYTTILTPVLLLWVYKSGFFKYIWIYFAVIAPFVLVHFFNGVNVTYYIRSFLLLFSVYVFSIAFYRFLKECKSLRTLFKDILFINIVFVIIALIVLFIPSLVNRFWYANSITEGVESLKRLRMLTYEPSYYSTLFVPIALYYYLKLIVLKLPDPKTVLILLTIPLLLSLSFGVILGLALSLLFTLLYGSRDFFPDKNLPAYFLISGIVLLLLLVIVSEVFPHNIFVLRIANVFKGKDTSFQGRTFDSFYLGWKIANEKSIYFGCGLGQAKLLGLDIFRNFYNNPQYTLEEVGIPNAVGDTFATFGIIGTFIRLALEVYFFFKTRVSDNYYRLSLFLFIFIYQFTGSFITNIAEYVIWIMAFTPGIFEEFDKKSFYRRPLQNTGS